PCAQIKVPDISIAAVWAGPPIDDVAEAWEADATMGDLVRRLAARRTPLDTANTMISDFVTGNAEERERKGRQLFAGLFTSLNRERTEVMNGIERFYRQQRVFAEKVRQEISELHALQDAVGHDQGKIDDLANRLEWSTRIFEERKKTIGYVCEVPVQIEQ